MAKTKSEFFKTAHNGDRANVLLTTLVNGFKTMRIAIVLFAVDSYLNHVSSYHTLLMPLSIIV